MFHGDILFFSVFFAQCDGVCAGLYPFFDKKFAGLNKNLFLCTRFHGYRYQFVIVRVVFARQKDSMGFLS